MPAGLQVPGLQQHAQQHSPPGGHPRIPGGPAFCPEPRVPGTWTFNVAGILCSCIGIVKAGAAKGWSSDKPCYLFPCSALSAFADEACAEGATPKEVWVCCVVCGVRFTSECMSDGRKPSIDEQVRKNPLPGPGWRLCSLGALSLSKNGGTRMC